jgi:tRNA modification GTPase
MITESTICALATSGKGALSIIRLSGPDSFRIVNTVFKPVSASEFKILKPNSTHFGEIWDGNELLDQVILTAYRAPNSYTGEDCAEITCHASQYIQKRILELLIENGAQIAKPGEYTQRAFLNGKMDLTQAEAVADLIAAESKSSHRIAMNQMKGSFAKELVSLRTELLQFTSMIELELDFSEEDVEFADRKTFINLVDNILSLIANLIDSFKNGNVIKNGVPVAIIGKPNVGKSSLLNRLLKEDRAIVSDIAGTTRDSIEDNIIIDDVCFRFIDTAGLRETSDIIENLGINRTYQKIEQASIVLLLIEGTEDISSIREILKEIRLQTANKDKQLILVINKIDLLDNRKLLQLEKAIEMKENENFIKISAKYGNNIDLLHSLLLKASHIGKYDKDSVVISNLRHFEALKLTLESLERVKEGLKKNISGDFLAQDLRQSIHYLGEITGEITTDEILGNIFKNFCIGK